MIASAICIPIAAVLGMRLGTINAHIVMTFSCGMAAVIVLAGITSGSRERRRKQKNEEALNAENVQRAKHDFMTMAAHQLNTPLASLRWNAQLLLDESKKMTPEQSQSAKDLKTGVDNLTQIITDLLNTASIELRVAYVENVAVDIGELLTKAIKDLDPVLQKSKAHVSVTVEKNARNIKTDANLLRNAVDNVLTYAAMHAKSDGKVAVSVTRGADGISVQVFTSGYEIPASRIGTLFEKQLPARDPSLGAEEQEGLGLYIVKSIADRLGWKVLIESKADGVVFVVLIPQS
jgi:signal transduction histidine kinase